MANKQIVDEMFETFQQGAPGWVFCDMCHLFGRMMFFLFEKTLVVNDESALISLIFGISGSYLGRYCSFFLQVYVVY